MKFFLGCDHAAFEAKEELLKSLKEDHTGHEFIDCGTYSNERCDYPDFAKAVAKHVQKGEGQGILLCGSGIGISIAANRYSGVRAALCRTAEEAKLSKEHNDSNVICLGARISPRLEMKGMVEAWLMAKFEEGRHTNRVNKFNELGEKFSED